MSTSSNEAPSSPPDIGTTLFSKPSLSSGVIGLVSGSIALVVTEDLSISAYTTLATAATTALVSYTPLGDFKKAAAVAIVGLGTAFAAANDYVPALPYLSPAPEVEDHVPAPQTIPPIRFNSAF